MYHSTSLVLAKLTSTNYLLWRSQIIPLVRSLGILHHLHSDEKPSAELEDDKGNKKTNPEYPPWIVNDGLLLSWLLGTMREDTLGLNLDAETAHELWSSLEEHLLPVTVEKEGHLKNLLMTLKKGSQSVDEYLKEFKSICDMLAAIKKPVDDLDKLFQFARGLGPRYENFRLAMLTKPPYPSFSQFVLALQGHEQALNAQKEEEKVFLEHAQADFGQRGRGRNGRGGREVGYNSVNIDGTNYSRKSVEDRIVSGRQDH